MDKEFDNTNRGAIWRNDKKTTEKHPDVTGTINVDGKDYWLSGWTKGATDSAKAPIMKFAVTPKDKQVAQKPQNESPAPEGFHDDLADIPF
jgi:hypothetical protein